MLEIDFSQLQPETLEGIATRLKPEERSSMKLTCRAYHTFMRQRLPLPIMQELATHTLPESYHFYKQVYAVSADHTLFAAVCFPNSNAYCRYLYLWNISTGECTKSALISETKETIDYYTQLTFSASGDYLLLGKVSSHPFKPINCNAVELWSIANGLKWIRTIFMEHAKKLTAMIPLPQDKWILAYENAECEIIDPINKFKPLTEKITRTQQQSYALSPDGQNLMSFSMGETELKLFGVPKSLDANKLFEPKQFTSTPSIFGANAVCFSEDNRFIAVDCTRLNFIYILNTKGVLQQKILSVSRANQMVFLGSDKLLVNSVFDCYLWDLNTQKKFKLHIPFVNKPLKAQTSQGKTTVMLLAGDNKITLHQIEHQKPVLKNEMEVVKNTQKRVSPS